MKVVDLRPRAVKWALACWGRPRQGRDVGDSSSSRLSPAGWYSRILGRIMAQRVNRRPLPSSGPPFLLSVGNLALGGTGKTPVVGTLARDLANRGLRGAILTRGFGSDLPGPIVVDASNPRAGDEARWHAGRLAGSGWTVVQARNRPRGLDFLLQNQPGLDVVLIEDAHQTAGLGRHLDLVILDRWVQQGSGQEEILAAQTGPVFPFGPWRESSAGADRAGILLVESETGVPGTSLLGQPVATFQRKLNLRDPRAGKEAPPVPSSWAGLSGIAHPGAFEAAVAQSVSESPALVIRCGDHVAYTSGLVERILGELDHSGADRLVTTAKDWVKLEEFWPGAMPVLVADLVIEWGNKNALPDLIEERVESLGALP